MKIYLGFVGLLALAVVGTTILALQSGQGFLDSVNVLMQNPWAVGVMVDFYLGIAVLGFFIVWLEASPVRGALWILAICLIGNVVAAVYLVVRRKTLGKLMASKSQQASVKGSMS
jgi:hypothetical protein